MKYRYIGETCVFADKGDIFEESRLGYKHYYSDIFWIGVPKWVVEDTDDFEPVNEELDEFKENLIVWLEDVIESDEKSDAGKRALKSALRHIKEI